MRGTESLVKVLYIITKCQEAENSRISGDPWTKFKEVCNFYIS